MVKIQCISIWYIHVDFKQIGQQSNNYDKIVYRIFYLHPYQCDKVCQWLATGWWFSPVSSTIKTDRHDITEILLKVAINTINLNQTYRLTNDSGTNCLPHILHGFLTPTVKTKYITHNISLYYVLYCQLNNTYIIVKWLTMHIIVSTLQSRYSQRFMTTPPLLRGLLGCVWTVLWVWALEPFTTTLLYQWRPHSELEIKQDMIII